MDKYGYIGIETLLNFCENSKDHSVTPNDFMRMKRVRKLMVDAPEVLPEIIRCKDCKHWREGITYSYCDKLYGMGVLDIYDYMTSEDDFCSKAERKTDGVDS